MVRSPSLPLSLSLSLSSWEGLIMYYLNNERTTTTILQLIDLLGAGKNQLLTCYNKRLICSQSRDFSLGVRRRRSHPVVCAFPLSPSPPLTRRFYPLTHSGRSARSEGSCSDLSHHFDLSDHPCLYPRPFSGRWPPPQARPLKPSPQPPPFCLLPGLASSLG